MENKTLYTDTTITRKLSQYPVDYGEQHIKEYENLLSGRDKMRIIIGIRKLLKEGIRGDLSPLQKAYILHEMITRTVTYNGNSTSSYSFIGPLLYGKSVCGGISEFYMIMCQMCGIDAVHLIGGTGATKAAVKRSNTLHAWNLIRLDVNAVHGQKSKDSDMKWYHVDVTWDLGSAASPHSLEFFLKSDSFMRHNRHLWNYGTEYKMFSCPEDAVLPKEIVPESEVEELCRMFKNIMK